MPSTSKKQAKFMAAAAHNPEFAKKAGIPVSVAKEYNKADSGRVDLQGIAKQKTDHGKSKLFKKGGEMKHDDLAQDKKLIKKAFKQHDAQEHKGSKGTKLTLKKGGRAVAKGEHAVQKQSKRGAKIVKMCTGGMKSKAK